MNRRFFSALAYALEYNTQNLPVIASNNIPTCIKAIANLKCKHSGLTKGNTIGYGKSNIIIDETKRIANKYSNKYTISKIMTAVYLCENPSCTCDYIITKFHEQQKMVFEKFLDK